MKLSHVATAVVGCLFIVLLGFGQTGINATLSGSVRLFRRLDSRRRSFGDEHRYRSGGDGCNERKWHLPLS